MKTIKEVERDYDTITGIFGGLSIVLIVILILALLGQLELTEIPAWLFDMGLL